MERVVEDYPRTLAELEARFSSEEACREYLFRLRWPAGCKCLRCGGSKKLGHCDPGACSVPAADIRFR